MIWRCLLLAMLSGLSSLLPGQAMGQAVRRVNFGRRLEPEASIVLHGAGQSDEISFAAYTRVMGAARPMLSMSYVDLHDDLGAYFLRVRNELALYPDLVIPQIGLSLNEGESRRHYEGPVARGAEDGRLKQLCAGLQSLGRPVFLRIGYEFNGSWNGYKAGDYVAAFRRVAGTVRAAGLENVALVWDWSADAELDAEHGGAAKSDAVSRYSAYYPGDDVVDWWGLNLFSEESLRAEATQAFLRDAGRHRSPVMIGESAPRGHPVSEGQGAVDHWFKPYFALIRSSPEIKAFCYIDWDWRRFPQWADWGDSRVQDDPTVLGFYKAQVTDKLYADARGRAETMKLLRAR